MRTFLIGDLHATHGVKNLNQRYFPEQKELTKEDVVINLGDLGFFWSNIQTKEEKYWLDWIAEKNFTFAFVDGNHEQHSLFFNLPIEEKWGGKVGVYQAEKGKIYYLRRGEIYTINNKKFLALGGARSYDKHLRTEHIDWWSTEELSHKDIENCYDNLEKHNFKVDYLISHTTRENIVHHFTDGFDRFHDPVAQMIENIDNLLDYKANFFGHFHNSRKYKDQETGVLYECFYGPPRELL